MKLLVIDTMQFFEFEVEDHIDSQEFLTSDECRNECAERILNCTTDLTLKQIATTKDANGIWETR